MFYSSCAYPALFGRRAEVICRTKNDVGVMVSRGSIPLTPEVRRKEKRNESSTLD